MENNQRNSRKRLNSLILLVAFTAIMLIVSTYAWFSAQKTVSITGIDGIVNVAEGLMISLDAKNWTQEIDFDSPLLDTTEGISIKKPWLAKATADFTYAEGKNVAEPAEMLPMSATGREDVILDKNGDTEGFGTGGHDGNTDMTFYTGININQVDLHSIKKVDMNEAVQSEPDYPGLYAIDLFLQNSSKIDTEGTLDNNGDGTINASDKEVQGTSTETLQLNTNSMIRLLTTGGTGNDYLTGLQYTTRMALAMYEPVSGTKMDSTAGEKDASIYVTATQDQILKAYNGAKIRDIAIWEPNADKHTATAVTQYNNKAASSNWNSKVAAASGALYVVDANGKIAESGMLPTYALTSQTLNAVEAVKQGNTTMATPSIAGIYNWNDAADPATTAVTTITDTGLERQIALQTTTDTTYAATPGGVKNLVSVMSPGATIYDLGDKATESDVVTFEMRQNCVIKCRLYLWLEGQDVDTINQASHGGGVYLDLGLVKGVTPGQEAS